MLKKNFNSKVKGPYPRLLTGLYKFYLKNAETNEYEEQLPFEVIFILNLLLNS